jgi:hypothetical protein
MLILLLLSSTASIFQTLSAEQRLMPFIHSKLSLGLELKRQLDRSNSTHLIDSDESLGSSFMPWSIEQITDLEDEAVARSPSEAALGETDLATLEGLSIQPELEAIAPAVAEAELDLGTLTIVILSSISVVGVLCYLITKKKPKL